MSAPNNISKLSTISPKLSATLRAQLNNLRDEPRSVPPGMSTDALSQEILQVSSQLLDKSRQAQQERERAREIADSLSQLPQQQNGCPSPVK
ncbi:putative mechanosensitive channel protein [Citrobacter koseri]|uniref:Putative mechanosensitive channel protein n=1 Tax=Citrobacter koseri TaxID=545 RepID=A0A2X2XHE1_CITKO|nr:putative mechanosensitive channel protein [Citrobacter koseri]